MTSSPIGSDPRTSAANRCAVVICAVSHLLGLATLAGAQTPALPDGPDPTVVVRDGRGMAQVRMAFPATDVDPALQGAYRDAAREIEQTLRDDLEMSGVFSVQGPTELSVLVLTGNRDLDFDQYRSLGNSVVLLASVSREGERLVLDGLVYDLSSKQSVLGKRYRGTLDQSRLIAHTLADALVFQFTGRPSLALTTIAFQSDRDGYQELYLMDYDGRNQRRISGHRSTSGYSDWSPTGDALAYMSYYAGTPGIYYVDLESSNKIPIYVDGVLNLSPSFAPDGQRLAFASSQDSNVDIYTCTRNCSQPTRITRSRAIDTNPAWSPDGSRIAFTSDRSGRPNVYVMGADGSEVRRVSFEGDYNEGACWRPDGTELVYASRERGRFRIAVTSLIDLQTQVLVDGSDNYEEPCFSPDGNKIIYTTRRGKDAQLWVVDRDGGNLRQLTHEGNSSSADWSAYPTDR